MSFIHSLPGSDIFLVFLSLLAARNGRISKHLKDRKGEKRSPEKENNCNEVCRIFLGKLDTWANLLNLFAIPLQRLENYNHNYIEFALFDVLQSVQLYAKLQAENFIASI